MQKCDQTSVEVINYSIVAILVILLLIFLSGAENIKKINSRGSNMDYYIGMLKGFSFRILPFVGLTVLSTMYIKTKLCGNQQYSLIILPFLILGIQSYIINLSKEPSINFKVYNSTAGTSTGSKRMIRSGFLAKQKIT